MVIIPIAFLRMRHLNFWSMDDTNCINGIPVKYYEDGSWIFQVFLSLLLK